MLHTLPDWHEPLVDSADPLTILMAREGTLTEEDLVEDHNRFVGKAEQIALAHHIEYSHEVLDNDDEVF